jgi:hypothetical protein
VVIEHNQNKLFKGIHDGAPNGISPQSWEKHASKPQ